MKQRGVLLFQAVLTLILISIVFGAGVFLGTATLQNIRADDLKNQCNILDRSLETWAKYHYAVLENSIREDQDGRLQYEKMRVYPLTLSELGEIQNIGYFASNIDVSIFTYYTQDNGTRYVLEVKLPNGQVYKSPQSN